MVACSSSYLLVGASRGSVYVVSTPASATRAFIASSLSVVRSSSAYVSRGTSGPSESSNSRGAS